MKVSGLPRDAGSASWSLRYSTRDGKRRLMKLADYDPIDEAALAALEADAAEHRKAIRAGRDPLAERAVLTTVEQPKPSGDTFREAALAFIAENKDGWKNPKHAQQWENTLATYAYPLIGDTLTNEITMDDVKRVLQQPYSRGSYTGTLWGGARETASRIRSRIEIVINAAKATALADNADRDRQALWMNHHNPADGKALKYAGMNGKQHKSNFKAMDWKEVGAFVGELKPKPDYSAKALLLTILCATRTSETLNAKWSEFDLDAATWTIPADRMKMGREHRVPLSDAAVTLLRNVSPIEGNPYVFPGARKERPLSNMAMLEMLRGMRSDGYTVHGFRSAFRDWITETTLHPDAIAEQALAHAIDNKVERAYRRGDAFERRRDLMQQWADYLIVSADAYAVNWAKFIAA
ncbi:site-specific integrase [Sphingomonas koreensis]|nr:site-specific integrase [Sphingomonas koreensis]